jgi:hypothetical protein
MMPAYLKLKRRRRGRENDAGPVDSNGEFMVAESTRGARHRKDPLAGIVVRPLFCSSAACEDIASSRVIFSRAAWTVGSSTSAAALWAISVRSTLTSRGASMPMRTACPLIAKTVIVT